MSPDSGKTSANDVKTAVAKAVRLNTPGGKTTTEMLGVAELIIGYIFKIGHWGMALIGIGMAFAVVALVTRLDGGTEQAMGSPEFVACLAFSAVVIVAGSLIHVSEIRQGWIDPYELPTNGSAEPEPDENEPETERAVASSSPSDQTNARGTG